MVNCNDVLDFFVTLNRRVASEEITCDECGICPENKPGVSWVPSWGLVPPCCVDGDALLRVAQLIPELQQWADTHPIESWLDRLKKALPECELANVVNPHCPGEFFAAGPGRENCPYEDIPEPYMDCAKCWNQEATDEL